MSPMPRFVLRSIAIDFVPSLSLIFATTLGCSVGDPIMENEQWPDLMSDTGDPSRDDEGGGVSSSTTGADDGATSTEGGGSDSSGGSEEDDGAESSESGDEFEEDETYTKTIRISASAVSGTEDLEDFPLFVSLIDADLQNRAQADGCDIAFYQGSTLLDFELEQFEADYAAAGAKLAAWVRVPLLSATEDTELSLHYGLPCESYDNPIGVWGGDYELVWHMNSDTDAQTFDSTINTADGVLHGEPMVADGKLGRSLVLDGIDDRIEGPFASELGVHSEAERTFSVWANVQHYDATPWGSIFGIGRLGGGCCLYTGFGINRGSDSLSFSVGGEWSQNANWSISEGGAGFDEWAHYVAVYDGNMGLKIYANGQLVHDAVLDAVLNTTDENALMLPFGTNYMIGGPRDEMRVSKRQLSGDWIATEYANQNDPSSFYVVGPQLSQSAP